MHSKPTKSNIISKFKNTKIRGVSFGQPDGLPVNEQITQAGETFKLLKYQT
jgi:hypothetical protein